MKPPDPSPAPEEPKRLIRGRDFVVTMASLASAGFGVMAALAWNEAIKALVQRVFPPDCPLPATTGATCTNTAGAITSLFLYAVIVSAFAVVVVNSLAKLAERLGGEKRL